MQTSTAYPAVTVSEAVIELSAAANVTCSDTSATPSQLLVPPVSVTLDRMQVWEQPCPRTSLFLVGLYNPAFVSSSNEIQVDISRTQLS